jgi:hypothetical protein
MTEHFRLGLFGLGLFGLGPGLFGSVLGQLCPPPT